MSLFGPNWRDSRCGHQYEPEDCPNEKCALRDALTEIARLTISQAIRDTRIRTETLLAAARQLEPMVPSPIGPLHAAGMMFCVEHLRKMAAASAEEVDNG